MVPLAWNQSIGEYNFTCKVAYIAVPLSEIDRSQMPQKMLSPIYFRL